MKKKMKLRLTIDVTYEGNEFELRAARDCLWDAASAVEDKLTGARLVYYDPNVEVIA